MVDTCALTDIGTSQFIDRSRRHNTPAIHVSAILTCCTVGKPSEEVPSFPFGSGAAWSLRR